MLDKKVISRIKLGLLIATILLFTIYIINKWMLNNQFDSSYPEITFDQDVLNVSVAVTEEELLAGVTATDKKDGDVTDTVIIESMSNLLEGNQRIVTYAAFDGDNHVGKAERRIQYTDYTSIRFRLDASLVGTYESANLTELLEPLHANDCIDGDISNQIIVLDRNVSDVTEATITELYEIQVTNSCGEVANLRLPIKFKGVGRDSGQQVSITLSEYLTYTSLGSTPDLSSFVTSATFRGEEVSKADIAISTDLDTSKPGVYTATYSLTKDESTATCDLIIVVEE